MGKASRSKRERRFNPPKPFKQTDVVQATETCGRPYDRNAARRTKCPVCDMDVFLHCGDCEIQITGCLCTAVNRMNEHDLRQFKIELQKRKAKEAGLILPYE